MGAVEFALRYSGLSLRSNWVSNFGRVSGDKKGIGYTWKFYFGATVAESDLGMASSGSCTMGLIGLKRATGKAGLAAMAEDGLALVFS